MRNRVASAAGALALGLIILLTTNLEAQERNRNRRRQSGTIRAGLAIAPDAEQSRFLQVSLVTAQRRTIGSAIEANGIISAQPNRVAKVGPVISGRVSDVLVELGQWIEEGQPMATLLSVEIGQAVSDYYKAVAELELATIEFERYQRLVEQEIAARKDFLTAEASLKIAEANLNASEKALHALGFSEEDVAQVKETHVINAELTLRAPVSGRVVERNVTVGERVGEDSTLFTIMDLRRLNVDAQVYEADICKVAPGQRTLISVNAIPSCVINGTVSYVGQVLDPATRTMMVRCAIDNPDEQLKAGMYVRVNIYTGSDSPVLCVPVGSIVQENGQRFVFVPDDDHYILREVQVGVRDDNWVQVTGGIDEGQQVVADGAYGLYSLAKQSSGQNVHIH